MTISIDKVRAAFNRLSEFNAKYAGTGHADAALAGSAWRELREALVDAGLETWESTASGSSPLKEGDK